MRWGEVRTVSNQPTALSTQSWTSPHRPAWPILGPGSVPSPMCPTPLPPALSCCPSSTSCQARHRSSGHLSWRWHSRLPSRRWWTSAGRASGHLTPPSPQPCPRTGARQAARQQGCCIRDRKVSLLPSGDGGRPQQQNLKLWTINNYINLYCFDLVKELYTLYKERKLKEWFFETQIPWFRWKYQWF